MDELRAEADARCGRALREIPLPETVADDSGVVLRQKYQQQADLYRRLVTDLQDLEPPRRVHADFEGYRAKTAEQAENRLAIADAQRANDIARFRSLRQQFRRIGQAKARLRAELGLRVCP